MKVVGGEITGQMDGGRWFHLVPRGFQHASGRLSKSQGSPIRRGGRERLRKILGLWGRGKRGIHRGSVPFRSSASSQYWRELSWRADNIERKEKAHIWGVIQKEFREKDLHLQANLGPARWEKGVVGGTCGGLFGGRV